MKLFAFVLFVGVATAGKLPSLSILPDLNGYTSAGHEAFLEALSGIDYAPQESQVSQHIYHQPKYDQGLHNQHEQYQLSGYQSHAHTNDYQSHHIHQSHDSHYHHGEEIPILRLENANHGDGSYHFGYKTANGIVQDEEGHLANAGTEHEEQVVSGSYSYKGDDGHEYTVHYTADANGFHATGDHLPTPPPIPEAIQRSLEYNAAHANDGDDGSYSHHHQSSHHDQSGYELGGAYSQAQHYVSPLHQTYRHSSYKY